MKVIAAFLALCVAVSTASYGGYGIGLGGGLFNGGLGGGLLNRGFGGGLIGHGIGGSFGGKFGGGKQLLIK